MIELHGFAIICIVLLAIHQIATSNKLIEMKSKVSRVDLEYGDRIKSLEHDLGLLKRLLKYGVYAKGDYENPYIIRDLRRHSARIEVGDTKISCYVTPEKIEDYGLKVVKAGDKK